MNLTKTNTSYTLSNLIKDSLLYYWKLNTERKEHNKKKLIRVLQLHLRSLYHYQIMLYPYLSQLDMVGNASIHSLDSEHISVTSGCQLGPVKPWYWAAKS